MQDGTSPVENTVLGDSVNSDVTRALVAIDGDQMGWHVPNGELLDD